jgi:hypothetical protein
MFYSLAAAAVVLLHFGFILFVLAGSLLALRYRWMVALHVPAAVWGVAVELTGRGCPLTAVENFLLSRAGQRGYAESFVEHYLLPIIYPTAMTRGLQVALACAVVVINLLLYGWLFLYPPRSRRGR